MTLNSNDDSRIVYVREVLVSDLPRDVQAELGELVHVYSVIREDGEQLALVGDRKLAFHLAREHDYQPHTVH